MQRIALKRKLYLSKDSFEVTFVEIPQLLILLPFILCAAR